MTISLDTYIRYKLFNSLYTVHSSSTKSFNLVKLNFEVNIFNKLFVIFFLNSN